MRDASGYVFYNTSEWTLLRLKEKATNNQKILQANFDDYLNGFSDNVKAIIDKFKLKAQVRHMANKDALLDVLEKFTSPFINLTPFEKDDPDGSKLPPLSIDLIIKSFNERWYQGWEATPEEQRLKFISNG